MKHGDALDRSETDDYVYSAAIKKVDFIEDTQVVDNLSTTQSKTICN